MISPMAIPIKYRRGVFLPDDIYTDLEPTWQMIEYLIAGTEAMREAGETYLPKEPREEAKSYKARLRRSFLFPQLRKTLARTVAQPFSRPVTLTKQEQLSDVLKEVVKSPSRDGTSFDTFARHLFNDMITYGLCHVLVDYPVTTGEETIADEQQKGLRPLFIRIHPRNLISWKVGVRNNGESYLEWIRFLEPIRSQGDSFRTVFEYQLREVHADGTWRILYISDKGTEQELSKGKATYTNGIPLFTAYARKIDTLVAEPPYRDLAEMNVCHWQASSDHRNLLRFARCATLTMVGVSQTEVDSATVGVNQVLWSKSPEAKISYTEHSGQAVNASEADLKRIEERMEVLGAEPLVGKAAGTATGAILTAEDEDCEAQSWVKELEGVLLQAFQSAADWTKGSLPGEFAVDIYSDFSLAKDAGSMDTLLKMRASGDISQETLLVEAKRRGLFRATFKPEEEIKKVAESAVFPDVSPEPDDDENPKTDPTGGQE